MGGIDLGSLLCASFCYSSYVTELHERLSKWTMKTDSCKSSDDEDSSSDYDFDEILREQKVELLSSKNYIHEKKASIPSSTLSNAIAFPASISSNKQDQSFSVVHVRSCPFTLGSKGVLTTKHTHPRVKIKRDWTYEFARILHHGDVEAAVNGLMNFKGLNKHKDGEKKVMADGIISSWIKMGASRRLLNGVVGVSMHRYNRLKANETQQKPGGLNGKQVTEVMIEVLGNFVETLKTEEGYPCHHRRMKKYIDDERYTTWLSFFKGYEAYCLTCSGPASRVMAYETMFKYMKGAYPHVSLHRSLEDECDVCIKFRMQLKDKGATHEEMLALSESQNQHLEDARAQRRALTAAIQLWGKDKIYAAADEVDQLVASMERMLGEFVDDPLEEPPHIETPPRVHLVAEDYGGNVAFPHYGSKKPSKAYYTSNLSMCQFLVCSLSEGINHVFVYDERAMGKDCDALCSLRFLYHFRRYLEARASDSLNSQPKILFLTLDNCVGQNKSQAVMMFFCFLSLFFYTEKVVVLFLRSGHSHMPPDRAWSHGKKSFWKKDLYLPVDAVECMNNVRTCLKTIVRFITLMVSSSSFCT
jgi:hypothetical protein